MRAPRASSRICNTLAETARDISARTEAHASNTIAEIAQLVQAASEAPRAAAEVIAELRQKLSDSMARDNAMLEERSRILETLGTLLDAVNHASTEQRAAIDALVAASADLLDRVGTRFTEKVDAETGKMAEVAAQLTGSAVEVASLGEAFGFAVQLFSQSNDKLAAHLQRIEGALGKSIARSDEQLAYYVAQAQGSHRPEHHVAEADRRGPAAARRRAGARPAARRDDGRRRRRPGADACRSGPSSAT